MGCDIHAYAEKKVDGKWETIPGIVDETFLDWRSYRVFGWLAGVRNYSNTPMIAPVRGFPEDVSADIQEEFSWWDLDAHTPSWVTLEEFLAFDYNAKVEDCRCIKQVGERSWDGGMTCEKGQGIEMSWKEFLGGRVLEDLQKFKEAGVERIIFWFDN